MAKMIGLTVAIKQGWIKKAVALLKDDLPEDQYRQELEEHISFELESPTNRRKAREILMRVWRLDTEGVEQLQAEGRSLILKYPERLSEISWCMFPLAYPVFYDVGKLMGKMFEFQDEITTNQIREKLFDEYGERGIIDFHTPKLISTMREIGGVVSETRGRQAKAEIAVENAEIICFMTEVAMRLAGRSYYTFSELTEFPFMFPFNYRIAKEMVLQNERFVTTNFGGELSVSFKE